MKEIKKYTDVIRYGKSSTEGVIQEGDIISITEKIDFSNASFRLDEENILGVSCYSRNKPLDEHNTLNGFYNWVVDNIVPIKDKLNPSYIYYGEWAGAKHKVLYKPEVMKRFWTFSVWDMETKQYLSDEVVISEAKRLNLDTVPYFYIGKFISFEHLMSFVGKSDMTLEPNRGEGIVVKNVNYFDNNGKQMFVKLVSEKFAEVQKQRLPKNPNVDTKVIELVKSVLTKPRVEKIMYKLADEGLLKVDYSIEDMGIILKSIGSKVYEDIMKEESDLFTEYEEDKIKRICGKNLPNVVKSILKEQGRI
ncbi:hypothetical protein DVV91_10055 [Clostridium botulinum]|uniref:RNA ligase family protein n=1 Tax=Clostridium botulinum TaxID=1491 RepID=UPI00196849ED|nr:RNA ligase family protein [Clostridium botulinum]MBN1074684.1 hypothetical protein [Clostridium botulinum]